MTGQARQLLAGEAAKATLPDQLLFSNELTRVSRRRLPDGSALILKEMLGPKAVQRLRAEFGATLEALP